MMRLVHLWPRRLRLLPLTIFAASLLLTVKLGALFTPGSPVRDAVAVTATQAQQAKPTQPPPPAQPAAQPQAQPQGQPQGQPQAQSQGQSQGQPPAAPGNAAPAAAGAKPGAPSQIDPISMSQSEIDILQALGERRRQLDERERAVDQREALLKAAEQRITEKVNELKAVQAKLEGSLKKQESEHEEQLRRLVKVYENMKPKEAARIFEQLEDAVLLDVTERMKEVKLAPVLASMDPKKATSVTMELAKRRQVQRPAPPPSSGG